MSTFADLSKAKITINQLLFRHLYYRYNAFIAPIATMLVCITLFFFVVVPQMQSWFALKDSVAATAQSLQVMHQNLTTVTNLDSAKLDSALSVATAALPPEKDFAGIVTSLQNAAAAAGTSLGDYSFTVGDLSGSPVKGQSTRLPVQLNISLIGGVATAQYFVAALRRQLPLSDVSAVQIDRNASIVVTVIFYYDPLPKITFADDQPLPVLSASAQTLLDTLAANSYASPLLLPPTVEVTPSPSPLVLPLLPSPTVTPVLSPVASPSANATGSAQ